jgi:hypothetical protein
VHRLDQIRWNTALRLLARISVIIGAENPTSMAGRAQWYAPCPWAPPCRHPRAARLDDLVMTGASRFARSVLNWLGLPGKRETEQDCKGGDKLG